MLGLNKEYYAEESADTNQTIRNYVGNKVSRLDLLEAHRCPAAGRFVSPKVVRVVIPEHRDRRELVVLDVSKCGTDLHSKVGWFNFGTSG